MDLGLSGDLQFPHTGGSTNFNISGAVGRYVSHSSLVGVGVGVFAGWGPQPIQEFQLSGRYRYLFHTRNPKIFPFLEAGPGVDVTHGGGTSTMYMVRGEAGVKCFIARNVSLEPAYNFVYIGSHQTVPSASVSALTIGLAFTL
ncbi:MAG TPA: hypothetical protein VMU19_07545 [Bryobacteraceae bacterium]|nr:hypothetical protein [Bryobacteraceae bacterium]